MANPGVGNKFVSVNLNKSYGQRPSSSGNAGASRVRSSGGGGYGVSGVGGGGGGGGGGMVVLSRSRSSIVGAQKGGPKLSVPPPLNLPSLRKEHERSDSSASGGGAAGAGSAGPGARPASSGIGWTKPSPPILNEKEGGNDHSLFDRPGVESHRVDGSDPSFVSANGGLKNSVYLPPSARTGTVASSSPSVNTVPHEFVPVEKTVVLRGEDFPSLHATLPTQSGGSSQKQKGNLDQKQSKKVNEEVSDEQMGNSYLRPPLLMQPQNQTSRLSKAADDKHGGNQELGGFRRTEKSSKQEDDIFPSPLPLLRLNHTSDWADDERDTRHGLPDRNRDHAYLRNESFRDRDNDLPRGSVLPKSDAWVMRDDDFGRQSSRESLRANSYGREMRIPSREGRDGSPWRPSPVKKDGFSAHDIGFDRNGGAARPLGPSREANKESKYGQSSFGYGARDGYNSGNMCTNESRFGRRDAGYGQGTRQNGNLSAESYGARGTDKSKIDQYGGDMSNHYRNDGYQNNFMPKTSGKVLPVNDSILNVGREKRLSSKKQYIEDPFLKELNSDTGFDGRDPLTGSLVGVLKRKKDVVKQADFHDPVREYFEAELERVQQMQEQERQRVIEEQARALEIARKEEEEKERLAREEEARRRRIEEEAREAAWRAEQERLEAVRQAEEQKMAREEEKRRVQLEEERRIEAARQKLLELEARIARRQSEGSKDNEFPAAVRDERMPGVAKGKDVHSRAVDVVDWEDGERMVERITSSASSDSSGLNRSFEMGSRPQFYRDGDPAFLDRGKPVNSWRRDATFDNGNNSYIWQDQDNGYRSPRRDAFSAGRAVARKEFHGGPGAMPARISTRGGLPDQHVVDDFSQPRGNRWNLTGEGDHYSGNLDPEFHDNFPDKFNDMGWGQGRSHGGLHAPYPERLYQNLESDGLSSFGRSRYSVRQPRVLPPPSLASRHKSTFRTQIERPGSSAALDGEITYHNAPRQSDPIRQVGYSNGFQDVLEQPSMVDAQKENTISLDKRGDKTTSRCDSQSSLSVSSPPDSPTHLSHDDLEDSGNSPLPTAGEGEEIPYSENDNVLPVIEVGRSSKITASGSVSSVEDEEWAIDNHQELSEQEEYEEDETGYREEDEVHGGDSQNVDLSQELKDMHLEEDEGMSMKMSQVVLGFNEGVEVGIPSGDEFERTTGTQNVSADISEEHGSSDRVVDIVKNLQSGNSSADGSTESSKFTRETDNALLDLSLQPVNVTYGSAASTDNMTNNVETSTSSQQPLATSANEGLPSSTVQPITLPVSAGPGQPEVPVKLQFGLFSGPSLIPSPVPAIQIGSIQMPLHYPHVGPSLTQIHPSQPPFFQFGQLRYASPLSQGILPLDPQSMSFVQPSVPGHYSLNPNQEDFLKNQAGQEIGIMRQSVKDLGPSVTLDDHPGLSKLLDQSQVDLSKKVNMLPVSGEDEPKARPHSVSHMNDQGHHGLNGRKNYSSVVSNKESQNQMQAEPTTSQYVSKAPGPMSGNKGKRYVYTVRNSGSRVSHPVSESSHTDFGGVRRRGRQKIQRTEFRVRENVEKRQREGLVSPNYAGAGEKSHFNGAVSGYVQSSGLKDVKPSKIVESESLNLHFVDSESKMDKGAGKEVHVKKPISGEANFKRNNSTVEDVDAPLQSGIVRVFKQPGIEAPSDEDDFIEVRSKRQMLNDRREQREKEIKAKSRAVKASQKRRSISQNNVVQTNLNKVSTSFGGEAASTVHSKPVVTDGQRMVKVEGSTGFTNNIVSPPLAPIGTPVVTSDTMADSRSRVIKSSQTGSTPIVSNVGTKLVAGLSYDNKNTVLDDVPTSLGPWGTARMNQQVIALTQTQLDEAMKPMRFDTHMATVGDHTTSKLSSSIMTHDKSFSSAASPLNSLLAGEKIQFGAVTSSTILPATSLSVSSGIGQAMDHKVHNVPVVENDCTLFFKKDKHREESCVGLEDPEAEAEAEAAASAVAVAAISSDEIVGNGCSVPVSDAKSFGGGENEGLTLEGGASNQQTVSQSRGEESLSVALPADLSVETPSLSLWPSLPSPQNSSGQMLSHFSGGPPSHFPCYEMNPMLGGHIFAFGPHDESAGTQPQSQKSNASVSGPLGAWQQCHSGVDSFYGPPTGFTGPFISPSGGIPGVQGPPHMVVYNHFAPVGQFGQVGLSFMGTTYIPSGKQPDWKHNPTSSAMGVSEGDMSNLNIGSAQRNSPNMPAPIQHLAPGSPLVPMASPLAMFDMSPFQSSTEVPVQTRWSHVPASTLHSAPLSMPMQQQAESGLPSQFSLGASMDQSSGNRFHVPSSSATENIRNYPVAANTTVGQLPDELGLADPSTTISNRVSVSRPASYSSTIVNGKSQNVVPKTLSRSNAADGTVHNNNSNSSSQSMNFAPKSQATQQQTSPQQYLHSSGYTEQRGGGVPQRAGSGGEWSHRRMGFQGRSQSSGTEKKTNSSKVKQIYVAKPASSRTSTSM